MKIKTRHFYLGILLVSIIILVTSGWFIFHQVAKPSNKVSSSPSPLQSTADTLPLSSTHKNVGNVTAFYVLFGQVSELTDTTVEIKSDDTISLPRFSILDTTDYYELIDNTPQEIDKSRITVSSNVDLTASYHFDTKTWTLNRITLLPPPPSITP